MPPFFTIDIDDLIEKSMRGDAGADDMICSFFESMYADNYMRDLGLYIFSFSPVAQTATSTVWTCSFGKRGNTQSLVLKTVNHEMYNGPSSEEQEFLKEKAISKAIHSSNMSCKINFERVYFAGKSYTCPLQVGARLFIPVCNSMVVPLSMVKGTIAIKKACGEDNLFCIIPLLSPAEKLSCLCQIIFSLACAYEQCEFSHNDLHGGNILCKTTKDEEASYVFSNKVYKVRTQGYTICIIDYGRSFLKTKDVLCSAEGYEFCGINPNNASPVYDMLRLFTNISTRDRFAAEFSDELLSDIKHGDMAGDYTYDTSYPYKTLLHKFMSLVQSKMEDAFKVCDVEDAPQIVHKFVPQYKEGPSNNFLMYNLYKNKPSRINYMVLSTHFKHKLTEMLAALNFPKEITKECIRDLKNKIYNEINACAQAGMMARQITPAYLRRINYSADKASQVKALQQAVLRLVQFCDLLTQAFKIDQCFPASCIAGTSIEYILLVKMCASSLVFMHIVSRHMLDEDEKNISSFYYQEYVGDESKDSGKFVNHYTTTIIGAGNTAKLLADTVKLLK